MFTVDYDALTDAEKEVANTELNKSPCNIWGYIVHLNATIDDLKLRIADLERLATLDSKS